MSWILDVLAVVIAAGAAYYAYRANQIAKSAPAEARTAATRDLIRDALKDAPESFIIARNAHNLGEDIPEVPQAIGLAVSTIERHGTRLPEQYKLSSIQSRLEVARMRWEGARRAEQDIVDAKKYKEWWQERVTENLVPDATSNARDAVKNAEKNIIQLERASTARRSELMTALDEAEEAVENYTRERDAADRSAAK